MTTGYNDRTCTNGKGGIKSVILFPLGNVTNSGITANEVTCLDCIWRGISIQVKKQLVEAILLQYQSTKTMGLCSILRH
jgi:hypothetical protein